jgi:hypothetical protein
VLRDPAMRRGLVAAGRERCRAFSWRRTAERTRAVYQHVAGASAALGERAPAPHFEPAATAGETGSP